MYPYWACAEYGFTWKGELMDLEPRERDPSGKELKEDRDPSGRNLGEPGTKGDLGKSPVTRGCLHYFPRALLAVAELSQIGANKYSWKGWESVPDGINRYSDALGRHEVRIEGDFNKRDPDTNVLESVAVAWNALARLELILREHPEISA